MKNYTTKTASLKATTIDTRKIDAKQIDTEKLFINGELFKENPNQAKFIFGIFPIDEYYGEEFPVGWQIESQKSIWTDLGTGETWQESVVNDGGELIKGSQTEGVLPNGVYVFKQIDDNFANCIGGNSLNNFDTGWQHNIPLAKFEIINISSNIAEQCIFENFLMEDTEFGGLYWVIKVCEEDDNLSEIYGGLSEENPYFSFLVSIPYYIPENDIYTSYTYSLRKTNLFENLRERFEQMRQRFEERKQQNLDNSAE